MLKQQIFDSMLELFITNTKLEEDREYLDDENYRLAKSSIGVRAMNVIEEAIEDHVIQTEMEPWEIKARGERAMDTMQSRNSQALANLIKTDPKRVSKLISKYKEMSGIDLTGEVERMKQKLGMTRNG